MFEVGQQVVYLGSKQPSQPRSDDGKITYPTVGRIYTVRAVKMGWYGKEGERPAILLVELVNPPLLYRGANGTSSVREVLWLAENFRPVKKTDISCFTALLTTKTVKELIRG